LVVYQIRKQHQIKINNNLMRIKLKFSKNTSKVPNNLEYVNSYIHKCLGFNNKYHNSKSDYCISRLEGGIITDGGRNLDFPNGGHIYVTSINNEFLNDIITGAINPLNKFFGFGMDFEEVEHMPEEIFYNGINHFKTTSMGFIIRKKTDGETNEWHTLNDEGFEQEVRNHLLRKLNKINLAFNLHLDLTGFDVVIPKHPSHKVVKRYSKRVENKVNICKLEIKTNKKVAEIIYNFGIGQSTGSGFGTVYTSHSSKLYRNDIQ